MFAISQTESECQGKLSKIKESFDTINLYEHQATTILVDIRDNQLYLEDSYKSFEECCEKELSQYGGYRRVNQLIAASTVINAAGEFGAHVKNERQARPLVRLVKTPEKVKEAIALALETTQEPTEKAFREAANKVVPITQNKKKVQEPMVPEGSKVTISSQAHSRCREEGVVRSKPNPRLSIVEFADGTTEAIADADLSVEEAPEKITRTRTQAEHDAAIAQLEEQHRSEIERLEEQIMLRIASQTKEEAIAAAQQEIEATKAIASKYKQEAIILQQKVEQLQLLEGLRDENDDLKNRIRHLEDLNKKTAESKWDMEKSAQGQKLVAKTDIKSLAKANPKDIEPDAAAELLTLLSMSLGNIIQAIPNAGGQMVLNGVALVLNCKPNKEAIALRIAEMQSTKPEASPQTPEDLEKIKFLNRITNKRILDAITWEEVREVCGQDINQLRRLARLASGELQKACISKVHVLLAEYIFRTRDESDYAWTSHELNTKVSKHLETLLAQGFRPGDIVEVCNEELPEYGTLWEVSAVDQSWLRCISLQTNKSQTFTVGEVNKKSKIALST